MSRADIPDSERHRMLPASPEAERGLIGSAFVSSEILDEALHRVPPEQLSIQGHRCIWEAIQQLHLTRRPVNLISVTEHLRTGGFLDIAGGPALLTTLACEMPTAANWAYYADVIGEKHTLRQLISTCAQITRRAFEEQESVKEITDEAATTFAEISAGRTGEEAVKHIRHHALTAFQEIEYAFYNRGGTIGIPTGFADLDRMIGGWQKGLTYYIGGRPAMGKSAIGGAFTEHVAVATAAAGPEALVFSVEMTGIQFAKRLILTRAEINQQRARDGFISIEKDGPKLLAAAEAIAASKIWVDDSSVLTLNDLRSRLRRWVKAVRKRRPPEILNENGTRKDGKPDAVVVIDYLQRLKGSNKRSQEARYLELQELAQGISALAKDLQIAIIVLAQLKRPKDKRPDTEPDMTEFRECGDIEQEAHVVGLLHRPYYYVKHNIDKQQALAEELQERFRREAIWKGMPPDEAEQTIRFEVDDLERYAKLIIDKQREGPVGSIDLRFIADWTKFETWDPDRARYSNNAAQRQVTEP